MTTESSPAPKPEESSAEPTPESSPEQARVTMPTPHPAIFNKEFPVKVACPACYTEVMTSTEHVKGTLTWVIFVTLFITGFCFIIPWCFCFVPCCVDSCRDVIHKCPNCDTKLGIYKRM